MSRKKVLIAALFVAALPTILSSKALAAFEYDLLEAIPGFYDQGAAMTDLPGLILAIYKFGIWTIGIAGFFMLVIGGFMYIASAGNTSVAGTAKQIIQDSLLGIVAAMAAYLFLYVINPDLTVINISIPPAIAVHEGVNRLYQALGSSTTTISASCTSNEIKSKINSISASAGVDKCLTFALLSTESGCNPNAQSSAGACGISQMMPDTAGISCEALKSDVDRAIRLGINLLWKSEVRAKVRGNLNGTGMQVNQAIRDLYAAYNGGIGTLSSSRDCSSAMLNDYGYPFVKWDCPNNPGGYVETVRATSTFLNFYMRCKSDSSLLTAS